MVRSGIPPLRLPLAITLRDVGDAQIEEAAEPIRVLRRREEDLRLIGRRTSAGVQNDPRVRQLDVAGVLRFNDLTAQHVDIELCRAFLVGDGEEMRDVKAFFCDRGFWEIHGIARYPVELLFLDQFLLSRTGGAPLQRCSTAIIKVHRPLVDEVTGKFPQALKRAWESFYGMHALRRAPPFAVARTPKYRALFSKSLRQGHTQRES